MTAEELQALCREWQERLGIAHWEIVVKVTRKEHTPYQGAGHCIWEAAIEQAIIQIRDPIDWDNEDFEQDMEKTLVHELLHLVFGDWDDRPDDSVISVLHEQAIDRTARALVGLKREAA